MARRLQIRRVPPGTRAPIERGRGISCPRVGRAAGGPGSATSGGLWVVALAVSLLVLVPPVYLLVRAAGAGDALWPLLFRPRTLEVLGNTVLLAATVAVAGVVIAVPLAWLTTRTDLPLRRLWGVLAPLPLVIPSYAGALAVIGSLGPRGLVQGWLEPLGVDRLPDIYGFPGAALTLTLFTYPYVYLTTRAALTRLDPAMEDASRGLGRGPVRTFLTTTVPLLRPAVTAGALLSALYAMSDFGVVTLLRYDSVTRVIYTQYRSAFDRSLAAALAVLLILLATAVLLADLRTRSRGHYHRLGGGAARPRSPVRLGRWRWPAFAWCALIAGAALGVPALTLLRWALSGSSTSTGFDGMGEAVAGSLRLAGLAAVATTVAALPIAALTTHRRGRAARLIGQLAYLGLAVPGIAVALAFVFIGARYLTPLYQTLPLLIAALVVRHLAQGVGGSRAALLQVSPRLAEASRSLGRSPAATFTRVTLPLVWPGVAAGTLLVFITVLKELPITLLLGPTGYPTVAIDLWVATGSGQYGRAATAALILILIAIPPTLILTRPGRDAVGPG